MLRLTLLRHAKSSWDDSDLPDHERQLTKRGTRAAARIGRYIAEHRLAPDLILCSDAIRARATLALVLSMLDQPAPNATILPELYLADPDGILSTIRSHAGLANHILVIGHNPGLHALALSLPILSKGNNLAQLAMKYPTAALAQFAFNENDWADIQPATGKLERYVTPRALSD